MLRTDGYSGDIRWNFEKFIIAPDGTVTARFAPQTEPEDPQVVAAIEAPSRLTPWRPAPAPPTHAATTGGPESAWERIAANHQPPILLSARSCLRVPGMDTTALDHVCNPREYAEPVRYSAASPFDRLSTSLWSTNDDYHHENHFNS
jgi:hypothetical protein